MNSYLLVYTNTLQHHGILGQKWGVRRFQNKDGSYTSAGKQRYGKGIYVQDPLDTEVKKKIYNDPSDLNFYKVDSEEKKK